MLSHTVVTPKPARKAPKKAAPKTDRKLSAFTLAGEEAKAAAQRKLLLETLKTNDWNLTATAEALGMGGRANVIRALRELAPDVYSAARADRRISPGNRRE